MHTNGRALAMYDSTECYHMAVDWLDDQIKHVRITGAAQAPAYEPDDPAMDGTDAAHSAYWRGQKDAMDALCLKVNQLLDGHDPFQGTANEPWQSLRVRLHKLIDAPKTPRAAPGKTQERIVEYMKVHGPSCTKKAIAYATGIPVDNVRKALKRMIDRKLIVENVVDGERVYSFVEPES